MRAKRESAAADEQAASARRQAAEAEERAASAESKRQEAREHAERAQELDPDGDGRADVERDRDSRTVTENGDVAEDRNTRV